MLFLGVTITPIISSSNIMNVQTSTISKTVPEKNTENIENHTKTTQVIIRKYHGNGTYTKTTVSLPPCTVQTLWKQLKMCDSTSMKLRVLKQYNLISSDANMDKFMTTMKKQDPTRRTMLRQLANPFLFNAFCSVYITAHALPLPILLLSAGSSSITGILNIIQSLRWLINSTDDDVDLIPSADIATTFAYCGIIGSTYIYTNGTFGYKTAEMFNLGACTLTGFVGYCIYLPIAFFWLETPRGGGVIPLSIVFFYGSAFSVAAFPCIYS